MGFVTVPGVLAAVVDRAISESGVLFFAVAMSGILSYSIVCAQFVLSARLPWIEKKFGAATVLRIHRAMAIVATFLSITHVLLLVWSRDNWGLIFSGAVGWPIQLGRIAAVILVLMLFYSYGRKWFPINNTDWRLYHGILAWTVLFCGFVHSIAIGSSFESPVFAIVWTGYFALAIGAWMHKWRSRTQERNRMRARRLRSREDSTDQRLG